MKTLTRLTEAAKAKEKKKGRALVSHTAQPLTAGRVHIHEVNIVAGRLRTGNGTRVKTGSQRTREARKTGLMFPYERLKELRERAKKARETGRKRRRTEQLGLNGPRGDEETNS